MEDVFRSVELVANELFYVVYDREGPVRVELLAYLLGVNLERKNRGFVPKEILICERTGPNTLLCNSALPLSYSSYAIARDIGFRRACVEVKSHCLEDIHKDGCPFNVFADTLLMPDSLLTRVRHVSAKAHNQGYYHEIAEAFLVPEFVAERRLNRFFRSSS